MNPAFLVRDEFQHKPGNKKSGCYPPQHQLRGPHILLRSIGILTAITEQERSDCTSESKSLFDPQFTLSDVQSLRSCSVTAQKPIVRAPRSACIQRRER